MTCGNGSLPKPEKLFEKLTQSRKGAEKRVVCGGLYYLFAFFAPLREMNFEKLTQSRKGAEKRVLFGRFYYPFAFFAPLREMNSAFSNSSHCIQILPELSAPRHLPHRFHRALPHAV